VALDFGFSLIKLMLQLVDRSTIIRLCTVAASGFKKHTPKIYGDNP